MYHEALNMLHIDAGVNPVEHSQPIRLEAEAAVGLDVVCYAFSGLSQVTVRLQESNDLDNWTPSSTGNVFVSAAPSVQLGSMFSSNKVERGFVRVEVTAVGTSGKALLSVRVQSTREA